MKRFRHWLLGRPRNPMAKTTHRHIALIAL